MKELCPDGMIGRSRRTPPSWRIVTSFAGVRGALRRDQDPGIEIERAMSSDRHGLMKRGQLFQLSVIERRGGRNTAIRRSFVEVMELTAEQWLPSWYRFGVHGGCRPGIAGDAESSRSTSQRCSTGKQLEWVSVADST
jgi:hypothetical protein